MCTPDRILGSRDSCLSFSSLQWVIIALSPHVSVQLALQLAVLVSKVARFDCPAEWPELVPTLLQVVRSPEDLPQQRALLVLHHVTKSLASKRLAGDRRVFQEVRALSRARHMRGCTTSGRTGLKCGILCLILNVNSKRTGRDAKKTVLVP